MQIDKFAVLISGRGSNLSAICESGLAPQIACVISNNHEAPGLNIAKQFNIPAHVVDHKEFTTREEFELKILEIINTYTIKLIVLAGFMRILSPQFIAKFTNRIINIHPSILPAFIGTHAQSDAFNAKVKISGATVHFVTDKLDYGPIIAQGIVPTTATDTEVSLSNRILSLEHTLYPFVIKKS